MEEDVKADIAGREFSGGGPGRAFARGACVDDELHSLLRRCARAGDMGPWNRLRQDQPQRSVLLEGADLAACHLGGADLYGARLAGADLSEARLDGADLSEARLDGAVLWHARLPGARLVAARLDGASLRGATLADADLSQAGFDGADLSGARLSRARLTGATLSRTQLTDARLDGASLAGAAMVDADARRCDLSGADLSGADLRGADLSFAIVDGSTLLADCAVDRRTDFSGVALGAARVAPGLRQLLDCAVRRKRWIAYCHRGPIPARIVKSIACRTFWWLSDWGLSTWRIVASFLVLGVAFAVAYWAWPQCVRVEGGGGELGFLYAVYLSIVTMTTLGFGAVQADPACVVGQGVIAAQVVVGYVLLAAGSARLVVMFTAGGPAEAFAPSGEGLWRRAVRGLACDPRRSSIMPLRKLAGRLCERNRIGRGAMACCLRLRRRLRRG